MNNSYLFLACLVSLFITANVFADTDRVISGNKEDTNYSFNKTQEFFVKANDTISAVSSRFEITRISFVSEIVEINAIAGELEYSISGKDIFLRVNSDKPINFFVKLENNKTYRFILASENIPAAQIFVKPAANELKLNLKPKNYYHDSNLPGLKKRLSQIINIALKPASYLGFKITLQNKKLTNSNQNFTLQVFEIIEGQNLRAEKIYITNQSDVTQHINLTEFLQDNIAGYLSKRILLPKEQTLLIRVTENKRSK